MRRQRKPKESNLEKRSGSVEVQKAESVNNFLKRRSSSGKVERFDSLSMRKCSTKDCREYTVNFISEHGREGVSIPLCENCVEKKGYVICAFCESEAAETQCNHTTKRKGSRRSRRGSRILQNQATESNVVDENKEALPFSIEQLLIGAAEQLKNNKINDE